MKTVTISVESAVLIVNMFPNISTMTRKQVEAAAEFIGATIGATIAGSDEDIEDDGLGDRATR